MRLTDEQKIDCVKRYTNGEQVKDLACLYGVSISATTSLLRRRIGKLRPNRKRKYKVNDTIFNKIDTEEKAYWIGFILGDGSVRNNDLRIELSFIDIGHLEKLKLYVQSEHPIKKTAKNCAYLGIYSENLVKSLGVLGIVPGKTYKDVRTPNISEELLVHFYRGILDADGWITQHRIKKSKIIQHEFGFSSYNYEFLLEIQEWLKTKLGKSSGYLIERKNRGVNKNQRVCQLIIGGNKNFVKLYNIFYKDANIYLDRKYIKSSEFIQDIKNG